MFYVTLVSSSLTNTSTTENNISSPEFKTKKESSNKNVTAKNKSIRGGALFQCQELDGGNAIECKTVYF